MKIKCDPTSFSLAFNNAASFVSSRSPKEILQYVKLEAKDNSVTLSATDTEVGVDVRLDVEEVISPGVAMLPAKRASSIFKVTEEEEVTIESDDLNRVTVQGRASRFVLPSLDPMEYPKMPAAEDGMPQATCKSSDLKFALQGTCFAADESSGRYALGGVMLEITGELGDAVATDGRRLSNTKFKCKGDMSGMSIVPLRSATLVAKMLSDDESEVVITGDVNQVLFVTPGFTVYTRLLDGRYPKWRQVIPNHMEAKAVFDVQCGDMLAALRQAAIVTDQESRGVTVHLQSGTMLLDTNCVDVGESTIEVPVSYVGESVKLTVDHRFFADFCRSVPSEDSITVYLKDASSPVLLANGSDHSYVLMPMVAEDK